jgi:secondary thiamine-phosphate synthase enzyme
MVIHNHTLQISTNDGISIFTINEAVNKRITESGVTNGFAIVTSRHTTTAITINENETRLMDDLKDFFARLVPENGNYRHNDIELRDCDPGEPKNAHSHITAMLLGSSEAVPIVHGELGLGQWQSIMLVELDGPRDRTINIQICGE